MMALYVVAAKPTTLRAPLASSGSSVKLRALVDRDGNTIAMASFGEFGTVVIKQGETWELIKFSGVTQNADGSADLTVAASGRSLLPVTPYTGASMGEDFNAGAEAFVTNDPLIMSMFGNIENAQTWNEIQTFAALPATTAGDPVNDNDLARKVYVDNAVGGSYPANRIVVSGTAGATLAAGNLVYLDTADGEWKPCDADTAATVENVLLGIAQGAGTDGNSITDGVLIRGYDNHQTGLTANQVYYASNTAGEISSSVGTKEVPVGFSISTTELYFSPGFNQHITEDIQDALAGTSGTPSASNKYVTNDDTTGTGSVVRNSVVSNIQKFGGDGTDGALAVSSGTTQIDLGGASIVVKNYTSISITGTGAVEFINPASTGTLVILKSQGDVTLTSSATPMLDLRGIGAAKETQNDFVFDTTSHAGSNGTGGGSGGSGGSVWESSTKNWFFTNTADKLIRQGYGRFLIPGSGGYSGGKGNGGSTNTGGDGGRGGGALYIECGGAWNFTTANGIRISGEDGSNGNSDGDNAGGGGGSGGNCGQFLALYNSLTANTGTVTQAGGNGGDGGSAGGGNSGASNQTSGGGGGSSGAYDAGQAGGDGTNIADGNNGVNGTNGVGGSGASGGAGNHTGTSGGTGGTGGTSTLHSLIAKNEWFG